MQMWPGAPKAPGEPLQSSPLSAYLMFRALDCGFVYICVCPWHGDRIGETPPATVCPFPGPAILCARRYQHDRHGAPDLRLDQPGAREGECSGSEVEQSFGPGRAAAF